jgi:hypothetical protein
VNSAALTVHASYYATGQPTQVPPLTLHAPAIHRDQPGKARRGGAESRTGEERKPWRAEERTGERRGRKKEILGLLLAEIVALGLHVNLSASAPRGMYRMVAGSPTRGSSPWPA